MGHSSSDSSSGANRSKKSRMKRKAKKEKKPKKKSRSDSPRRKSEEQNKFMEQVDMEDVERLLFSLLQLSPQIESEVFKQLDSWGIIYLQDLGDLRLRKKLRHLLRALLVGEVEGERGKGWRKLPRFSKPLAKLVRRTCKTLRPRVDAATHEQASQPAGPTQDQSAGDDSYEFNAAEAERKAEEAVQRWRKEQGLLAGPSQVQSPGASASPQEPSGASGRGEAPIEGSGLTHWLRNKMGVTVRGALQREEWMLEAPNYLRCLAAKDGPDAKRRQILLQKQKDDEEAVRVKAIMEEWNKARKIRSLREMKEEGEFAEGEEAYKKWKRSVDAARAVWGKRAAEQAAEHEFKDDAKKGQPWQRFDRDRDLQITPQVSHAEYQKLLEQTKLNSRFKSSWQTSFV